MTESPAKINPRTKRSQERLEEAKVLIAEMLASGEWVSSREVHRRLAKKITSDGLFGRAKSSLGIEHRRVVDGKGKARYDWRLPKS
jgi:hypothetical protein